MGESASREKNLGDFSSGELAARPRSATCSQNPTDQFFTARRPTVALVGENLGMPREEPTKGSSRLSRA